MTIQSPPPTSVAPAQKTVTFATVTADIVLNFRRVRCGGAGNLSYRCALDGSTDTIVGVNAGETLEIAGSTIFLSGTTVTAV